MTENNIASQYFYMYNGHIEVVLLIEPDGTVRVSYYYDAFGVVLDKDLKDQGEINNLFGFSGYQYDEETEMYYLNARMYDPKFARFLQEDTYRGRSNDPLSLNLYTYSHNNPIRYYDPTGHMAMNMNIGGAKKTNYVNRKITRALNSRTYLKAKKIVPKVKTARIELYQKNNNIPVTGKIDLPTKLCLKNDEYKKERVEYLEKRIEDLDNSITGYDLQKNYQKELDLLNVNPNKNPAVGVKTTIETRNGNLPAVYVKKKDTDELVKVVEPAYAEEFYESVKPELGVHNTLDIAGTVFEGADTINGIIYTLEGDKLNATLSFAAQIPIAGIAATGSKVIRAGAKYGDEAVQAVEVVVKSTDEIIDAAQTVTSKSDEAVKTAKHLVGEGKGKFNWSSIKATQEVIEGTNVPRSLVIKDLMVNGKEVWVGGNATKHMGEFINSANKAGGGLLSENEIMESFMNAAKLASEQTLKHGDNRLFVGGWEIGINGETGVIYHTLMK